MSTSIKCVVFGGLAASLLCGAASADPKAPTVWQPPAEISGKPAAPATGAPATQGTPAATAAPVDDKAAKAAKEEACAAEAKAKGLKKGKKWAFVDACMKK